MKRPDLCAFAAALLLSACSTAHVEPLQQDDLDFSLPAAEAGLTTITTRADIEALPANTRGVTAGDHGSRELTDSDIEALLRLKQLERVHLRHCGGIGNSAVRALAQLSRLRELDLSGCKAVTDAGILALKECPSLRTILLNHCPKVTKPAVKELERALPRADIVWSSAEAPMGGPPDYQPK